MPHCQQLTNDATNISIKKTFRRMTYFRLRFFVHASWLRLFFLDIVMLVDFSVAKFVFIDYAYGPIRFPLTNVISYVP